MDYRDRSRILVAVGVILFLAGLGFALLAPLESYTFYLFSDGGRFHYEGFGLGSLMFGNIASQILGYYLIAVVLIPLGYGHIKLRRWARSLALTLSGFWVVMGIPISVLFLLVLFSSKDVSLPTALIAVMLLVGSYLILPALVILFYRSRHVRLTFEARDPHTYWIDRVPVPVLVVGLLLAVYAVTLHIPLFFSGIFPLFGTWAFELQGIALLDVSIWMALFLAWGTIRRRMWAWWGSLAFLGLLTGSSILALSRSSLADILAGMRFPPTELEILARVPIGGVHLVPFVSLPLIATIVLIVYCRRYFVEAR